ncbi:carbohydrate ABC transporter membrane protein 2 (CUT1 family) [Glaciihabitans tibetensis]|uniref:Carbohydrate ABC transporter membrane protein 2 (CUT1 family) n=1 Tax=Glaciihabitans tibetensis TaxID=1266600 RepID=A0A2T0V718_9MICO|nr:carbohydrate ABC transporter permease [Glaciihabitans tibetensis]PRY65973.1 carbohydrate ABC transporter membrane protein 2 (CUT1 family) [Glaciihabitans tibetensis]
MSAVIPANLPVDEATEEQLGRGEKVMEATRRTKKRLTSRGATIAALIIAIIWMTPTLGIFVSSFRPAEEVRRTGWWTILQNPGFTMDNYVEVLQAGNSTLNLANAMINSIAITIPATVIPMALAALAAYALAWIDFRGRNILFVSIFALQIVPIQMALVPLLSLFSRGLTIGDVELFAGLDASGSYTQVWIAHSIFALPLAIFLLHNFISEIPGELIEAARVDGAGHGQIFFRIVLPLIVPAIAAFAIFQFIWVWNDLLVALVFADGAVAPVTKLLAELSGNRGQDWHLLTAGAFISIVIPLIVFISLQRYFVRGLLAGASKG